VSSQPHRPIPGSDSLAPMIPIASMASWDVGTVSVTSKVVTGGAAGFCSTGTGITSTGTTTGGAAPAARSCAGSILVQASADVGADGVSVVVVMPQFAAEAGNLGHHRVVGKI